MAHKKSLRKHSGSSSEHHTAHNDSHVEHHTETPKAQESAIKEVANNMGPLPYIAVAVIIVAAVVIAAALFMARPAPTVPPADNITINGTGAVSGDEVKIQYTGKFTNGSTFDSGEFSFTLGAGQVIPGFNNAVTGMKAGEEKTVTIEPKDAYGEYDPSKVRDVSLFQENERFQNLTIEQFTQAFGKEPVAGENLTTTGLRWPLSVTYAGNETATIRHDPTEGQIIEVSYGTIMVSVTADKLKFTILPKIGESFADGGRIVGFNDTSMQIDMNHPLAGKILVFTIKVLEIKEATNEEPVIGLAGLIKSDRPANSGIQTFYDSGRDICYEDGKPIMRMYAASGCGYCKWNKPIFEKVVKEYIEAGKVTGYLWEDNKNLLSEGGQESITKEEHDIYTEYNPQGSVPTIVMGCKYYRIGSSFARMENGEVLEEAELRAVIEDILAS